MSEGRHASKASRLWVCVLLYVSVRQALGAMFCLCIQRVFNSGGPPDGH